MVNTLTNKERAEYTDLKTTHVEKILSRAKELTGLSNPKIVELTGSHSRSLVYHWKTGRFPTYRALANLGYRTRTVPLLIESVSGEEFNIGVQVNKEDRTITYDGAEVAIPVLLKRLKNFFRNSKTEKHYHLLKILDDENKVKKYQWLADIPHEYSDFLLLSPSQIGISNLESLNIGLNYLERKFGVLQTPFSEEISSMTLEELANLKKYTSRMEIILKRVDEIRGQVF